MDVGHAKLKERNPTTIVPTCRDGLYKIKWLAIAETVILFIFVTRKFLGKTPHEKREMINNNNFDIILLWNDTNYTQDKTLFLNTLGCKNVPYLRLMDVRMPLAVVILR